MGGLVPPFLVLVMVIFECLAPKIFSQVVLQE
jgi:hypothetical protein